MKTISVKLHVLKFVNIVNLRFVMIEKPAKNKGLFVVLCGYSHNILIKTDAVLN